MKLILASNNAKKLAELQALFDGLGVTLSKQQAEWAQKAIVERGLSDLAEVDRKSVV